MSVWFTIPFCDRITDVICYVKNLREIINGLVGIKRQTQSFRRCEVMPQKTQETKQPHRPSYILLGVARPGYALLLLLCYSCITAPHHMEEITHTKARSDFLRIISKQKIPFNL